MQSWGLTDPGSVRKQNQDAYRIEQLDRSTLLCVVCDGMGGAKSGNIASTLATEVFVEEVRRSWKPGLDSDKIDQPLLPQHYRLPGNGANADGARREHPV